MNNLKEAILERLINCGKKNKRLKAPVMILITLFLILFHSIRNFFMQFKLHPFRQRVLASVLCLSLVISSMPAVDYAFPVLAAENSEEVQENELEDIQENTYDGIREIVSFTELPDEVKEQTVAVGTPLESLALPDTLTALCRMTNDKNTEDNADSDKKQDSEEKDKQTDEGKKENSEEDSDEGNGSEPGESDNQTGDESGASDNEGEGKEDEIGDSSNAGEGTGAESGDSGNEGGGDGSESGDSNNAGGGDGNESGDSGNEGGGNENESGNSDNGDAEKPENSDIENGQTSESGSDEEKGDAAENGTDAGSGEASEANTCAGDVKAESGTDEGNAENKEAVETQETFTITLPENYAMPDELPEIKELIYQEASDTPETESGENGSGSGEVSDLENRNEEIVTIDGITWESMPEYDGEIAGAYLFTPVISGGAYTLAEDVELPEISVTVAEAEIMLAEEELPDVSESTMPMCGVISRDTTWGGGALSNGELIINPGVKLTINGQVALDGNVTIKGGGTILRGSKDACFRFSAGNVTVADITIDGDKISASSSMMEINSGGNLTLDDGCLIQDCIYNGWAGAIRVNEGGRLVINNATIQNCQASAGGAIYMGYGRGEVIIKDGVFRGNKAVEGGFILNCMGNLEIYGGSFVGNTASNQGGCIWHCTHDNITYIQGGYFKNNTCSNAAYKASGGIYLSTRFGGITEKNKLIVSSNANFCGDGDLDSGTDGIMLDSSNVTQYKIWIRDTLSYPVTLYVKAVEGYVIAEGESGYRLLHKRDMKKIIFRDIGNSRETWYAVLDEENNQVKLSKINPGYGLFAYYISNGAQGQVVDDNEYKSGDTIIVQSDNELSWEGHKFVEWNTQPDGSGIGYQPGDEIKGIEDDINLYAIFKETGTVTATFYSGVDNHKVEISAKINGETQTASLTAPSLDELQGYTAVGWNKSESGYTAEIAECGETEISQDTSFYGVYKKDAVLSYDLNYDSGYEKESETDTIYATVNEETINYKYPGLTLASAPDRAGYIFTGWNIVPDGTSDTYEAGTDFELRGDTTLYAQWEIGGAQYTVEHYLQDVSGDGYTIAEEDTETLSGTAGEVVNAAPKTYRGFIENITHESRSESGTVAADGSLVLRLYYDRVVYVIAFDLNGGTGTGPEAQELRYGTLLQDVDRPEKPGYTFLGWYMGKPGTEGKAWDFDKKVEENTEKQSQVLHAGWVDDIAPVLMQAEFNEGYKNFFDWLIRKKDLIITVPIIEEGSGVKQADYVLASLERSDSGNESAQAQIIKEDGRTVARITISYDYKGTVSMTCSDNAGNISADKTLTSPGGGAALIVEDNAPEITFSSKDGSLSDSFYDNVTVTVSVNDEGPQGNADTAEKAKITGGIASVTYSTDNGAETAVEGKGFESGIVPSCDFSVEISGVGEHILKVTATDNAGNKNESQARIRIAQKPAAEKDKPPVRPVNRKKSPELNSATPDLPAPDSSAPVTEQFIALANAPQPVKSADPIGDNEPRTGDTSHVEVYATAAMVTGLLYVRLYFTADKTGMTQEEKEQFLSLLISWAKRGGKPRRLFATAVIFLFLVYYHSIGKCKAYDVKFSYNGRKV